MRIFVIIHEISIIYTYKYGYIIITIIAIIIIIITKKKLIQNETLQYFTIKKNI